MFVTIWMCTQEWSLISIRATAFTFATCHQPLIWLVVVDAIDHLRSFCSRARARGCASGRSPRSARARVSALGFERRSGPGSPCRFHDAVRSAAIEASSGELVRGAYAADVGPSSP